MRKIENPIFVLNAPKRCGKDTVAREMAKLAPFTDPVSFASFKDPIFSVFNATVNLPEMEEMYDVGDWKDTPHPKLEGKTPRQLLIHISENFVKPFFGSNYYGKYITDHITHYETASTQYTWVIPDGGFVEEIEALYQKFPDRLVIVQFKRPGFEDFKGDSRNFINHDKAMTVHETNEDGSEALAGRLMAMIAVKKES